jgi:hypothetical protein
MQLGLTWGGGEHAWDSAYVLVPLLLGVAIGVLFCLWEWKGTPLPLMPLRLFHKRIVVGGLITQVRRSRQYSTVAAADTTEQFINGWVFLVQVRSTAALYRHTATHTHSPPDLLHHAVLSARLWPQRHRERRAPHSRHSDAECVAPGPASDLHTDPPLPSAVASTASGAVLSWTGMYRWSLLFGWTTWTVAMGLFSTLKEGDGLGKQVGYGILAGVGVGNTLSV